MNDVPFREHTLDRKDAAKYLGVSVPTLARWASNGTGPAYYRIGKWTRYKLPDLDKFLEERRRVRARADDIDS